MISALIDRLVAGYGILLTLAAAGLIFANLSGFVASAFQFGAKEAPDAAVIQTWTHRGWVFGVGIALLGVATKTWKKRKPRAEPGEDDSESGRRRQRRWRRTPPKGRRCGRLASAALGGLGGALLGGMLGGTFVLLWFSISYSPLAPGEWASSVSVERQRAGSSVRTEPVTTTDHPVAQIAFGAPLLLGAIAGAIFGGVAGVTVEK